MNQDVTVSTKIPKKLKEKMQQLKIKPAKILRRAIEDEVKRREILELKKELAQLKPTLEKLTLNDAVNGIRDDRES